MELEGKVWKSGGHWLVEVPSLDVMTQGHTKEEALEMIRDAILELARSYFSASFIKGFDVAVNDYKKNVIGIAAIDSAESRTLLALSLRRQREQSGSTIREASKRLGSDFPNTYAQYEKGKTKIPLEKYELLLQAANPERHSLLRVV
jgi:hypothetical protein